MLVAVKEGYSIKKAVVFEVGTRWGRTWGGSFVEKAGEPTQGVAIALEWRGEWLPRIVLPRQVIATWEAYEAAQERERKRRQAEQEAALKASFVEFFAAHPEAAAIQWRQYTPYFNDGEACYFGVCKPAIKTTTSDGFIDLWDRNESLSSTLYADVKKLACYIQSSSMESVLKAVFGDHSEVTVYSDRITVETCDHD